MKVGDLVYLKDYTDWSDYRKHKGQPMKLIAKRSGYTAYIWIGKWKDGQVSSVKECNLIKAGSMRRRKNRGNPNKKIPCYLLSPTLNISISLIPFLRSLCNLFSSSSLNVIIC